MEKVDDDVSGRWMRQKLCRKVPDVPNRPRPGEGGEEGQKGTEQSRHVMSRFAPV